MDTKEIESQIETAILAMSKDPKNVDNYHHLANLYALISKFDKVIFPKNKSEICGTFLHEAKTPPKVW